MTVPGAAGNVLIVGHPYVDVWQAIRPKVLGIEAWPAVPRGGSIGRQESSRPSAGPPTRPLRT